MESLQDQLKSVSSYASKWLRQKFGRGPESCRSYLAGRFLVFVVRGFLSPMEEVLLQQGQVDTVHASRQVIIEKLLSELQGVLQVTMDVQVRNFYHDWNLPSNTGMIVAMLESPPARADAQALTEFPGKAECLAEVHRISGMTERMPDHVEIYQITPQIYLIWREGILLRLEKALIAKGLAKELRLTKAELEKSYFNHDSRLSDILQAPMEDLFVDWNLKDDNSLIGVLLQRKR